MSILFLDTSALVKLYLPEQGSAWMKSQCYLGASHNIIISRVTLVEAVATFCRKARETDPAKRITEEERNRIITLFRGQVGKQYEIINVTVSLYTKAGNLCRLHPLRAYDAVQLACALEAKNRLVRSGLPVPVFLSADNKLLDIAHLEGLNIENPHNHP